MDEVFTRTLLDNLHDGVYYVDRNRVIRYWNKAAEQITGYPASQVIGSCCADNILRHVDAAGHQLCQEGCPLALTLIDGQRRQTALYLHHKGGHRVPVLIRIAPIVQDGETVGAVEVFGLNSRGDDLEAELSELRKLACVDALTDIPNRRHIEQRLRSAIDELNRYGVQSGVLLFDVDHFKEVNDTFGHPVGDRVLQMVAKTMRGDVRSVDTIGRWGGDEFLCEASHTTHELLFTVAERLRLLVASSTLMVDGRSVAVTISVGATMARMGDTPQSIVSRADKLLYQAKRAGRNRLVTG